jgi:hypothetical protein
MTRALAAGDLTAARIAYEAIGGFLICHPAKFLGGPLGGLADRGNTYLAGGQAHNIIIQITFTGAICPRFPNLNSGKRAMATSVCNYWRVEAWVRPSGKRCLLDNVYKYPFFKPILLVHVSAPCSRISRLYVLVPKSVDKIPRIAHESAQAEAPEEDHMKHCGKRSVRSTSSCCRRPRLSVKRRCAAARSLRGMHPRVSITISIFMITFRS